MNIDQVTLQSKQTSSVFKLNVTETLAKVLNLSTGVVIGASLLAGCVIDREAPSDPDDTPVCDESMSTESAESQADELCSARGLVRVSEDDCSSSAECEEIMVEECGESRSVFCREGAPRCTPPTPIDLCAEEGLVSTTAEDCEGDPSCQVFTYYTDDCDEEVSTYCIEDRLCPELPRPTPEEACEGRGLELTTRESCEGRSNCERLVLGEGCDDAEEVFCHLPEECGETGVIDPNDICSTRGLDLATQEECEAGADCITITTEGPCGLSYDTLCQSPEIQCDAWPTCPEGLAESPSECRRGELGCELAIECGYVISCRPELVCDLAPMCDDDEVASQFGCEADEENCRVVEECGETIFCRPQELCRAIPTCEEGRFESPYACLATESEDECRSVTVCGSTIVCR